MTLVSGDMTYGRLDRLPFNQNHLLSRMWIIMSDTRATTSINLLAAVEQVFKIGSMEPGAMLFDASKGIWGKQCFTLSGRKLSRVKGSAAYLSQWRLQGRGQDPGVGPHPLISGVWMTGLPPYLKVRTLHCEPPWASLLLGDLFFLVMSPS